MSTVNLSYIITTYNKLDFLKISLPLLLENIKEDEELIIVDGGSTDGTFDYLNSLHRAGKINQFISEKDFGEAHGFNKGMMLAKGILIKEITDDDVFDYTNISKCKEYMLANPKLDLLVGNTCAINITKQNPVLLFIKNYEIWFREWLDKKVLNSFFGGLCLIIRRDSLPYLGLFDTSFKHVDFEYSVRITSLNAKIAFCTDLMVTSIQNPTSNSMNFGNVVNREVERVTNYYNYIYPVGKIKEKPGTNPGLFQQIKNSIFQNKIGNQAKNNYPDHNYAIFENINYENMEALFSEVLKIMVDYNRAHKTEFISNLQ